MTARARSIPIYQRASELALWPACYTLGVYLLGVLGLGLPSPGWATVLYLLLIAHGCYLLDRVKLSDARQDPADAIALPDRALLYAQHARAIRAVLLLELCIASITGWLISPALSLIPLAALLGVQIYAGRGATPGKPRFKDLPALKSFFISSAHLALVVAVLWGNDHRLIEHPSSVVLLSLIGLWLIVSGDAILCDIDDHESDALYGTRSLPVLVGARFSWMSAQGLLLIGCVMLLLGGAHGPLQLILIASIFVCTLPTLRRKNRRDLVDARLLPLVLLALMMR